jgi:hypothetical protein
MRPGELWDPPRATTDQRAYVTELLTCALDDVSRVSELVIDQLAHSYASRTSHLHGIVDAIKALERVAPTNAKQATRFEYAPLKGLWHQHYLSAMFLPHNLADEMQVMGAEADKRIAEILSDELLSDHQKANLIAHDFTVGLHQRRSRENRMTGEWLVFARDSASQNFYLAAASHAKTRVNRALMRLIRARCGSRFIALLP